MTRDITRKLEHIVDRIEQYYGCLECHQARGAYVWFTDGLATPLELHDFMFTRFKRPYSTYPSVVKVKEPPKGLQSFINEGVQTFSNEEVESVDVSASTPISAPLKNRLKGVIKNFLQENGHIRPTG